MTSVLSCLVATIALAADPGLKGLPFGVPPAPEDAVIAQVAPPQCLFYVNWAGTASPRPGSSSETGKLLAEPEVQEFFNGISKVIGAALRNADKEAKEPAATAPAKCPPPPGLTGEPRAAAGPSAPVAEKSKLNISAQDYGDWLNVLLTHPTACFITDVNFVPPVRDLKTDTPTVVAQNH